MLMKRWFRFSIVALVLLSGAVGVLLTWPQASVSLAANPAYPLALRQAYSKTVRQIRDLESRQTALHQQVVSSRELNRHLSLIQLDAASGNFAAAMGDIRAVRLAVANWNLELNNTSEKSSEKITLSPGPKPAGTYLPILLYHYPPPNFEQQLRHLEQAGYTVIDLDQALAGLRGEALPTKPVVITFDDGFAAQMNAYTILARHHMKATYYIVDAGAASRWCIGAGRRYGDPLQPPGGCGDGYLTWDQVRQLDKSGLITIAGHTVNHRNLASLSEVDQRFEIINGKAQLEAQLGHSIRHFAYPYGGFNATTLQLVREAGYLTAVTTIAGDYQPTGSTLALRRVRDAMLLP